MSTLSGGSAVVKDGLVFYVDPANPRSYSGTGSVFYNQTAYNNVGGLTGSPSVGYFRPENGGIFRFHTTAPASRSNSNFIKFGTQSYPNEIDPLTGLTNSTISIFVRILVNSGQGGSQVLFSRYGTTNFNGGFLLSYVIGDKKFYLEQRTGGSTPDFYGNVSSTATASLNQWYHVCGTIEGNQRKIYINGVLDGASASSYGNTASYANVATYIGTQAEPVGSFGYYLIGDFSCAMIYNRALSASEVSQNFNVLRYRFGI